MGTQGGPCIFFPGLYHSLIPQGMALWRHVCGAVLFRSPHHAPPAAFQKQSIFLAFVSCIFPGPRGTSCRRWYQILWPLTSGLVRNVMVWCNDDVVMWYTIGVVCTGYFILKFDQMLYDTAVSDFLSALCNLTQFPKIEQVCVSISSHFWNVLWSICWNHKLCLEWR